MTFVIWFFGIIFAVIAIGSLFDGAPASRARDSEWFFASTFVLALVVAGVVGSISSDYSLWAGAAFFALRVFASRGWKEIQQ